MNHSYISPELPIYSDLQNSLSSSPQFSQSTQPSNLGFSEARQPVGDNAQTQPYCIPIPSNKSYTYPPKDYHTNSLRSDSTLEEPSSYTLHTFSPVLTSPLANVPFDHFQHSTFNSSVRNVQRSRSKRYQSIADPSLKLRSAFRKPPSIFEATPIRRTQAYSYTQKASVLKGLTTDITKTYRRCNPAFAYELTRNPRRVLTKPSKAVKNDGYDNENNDFILYVNDVLGDEEGHQYLVLEILGAGTFGQVVKCLDMKTNELVGVKVVKNKKAYFQQSITEVKILEWLNEKFDPEDKRHLLRLLSTFIHRRHLCLVFELLSVNLYELIKQNQFRGLSTNLVRVFISQILDALCVLKEAKIIHCDLKPENILLKSLESATIKVIDFGSACHEQETVYTYIQSRFYRSPEVLMGLPYTTSIDMWSLGCIAMELYLGLPLFPGSSEYNQLSRIVEMLGTPPAYMIEVGKNGFEFFERVLSHDNQKTYHLKSIEQYSKEHNCKEQPSKRYFSATNLPELIRTYPLPKQSMSQQEIDKEMKSREILLDFVQGLLNLNPLERWSPHQAKLHPFISGAKYTGHFIPPTMKIIQDSPGGLDSNPTASNILRSVPSPKDEGDILHPQITYPSQEPELISNQIRPKVQPHYQPSLFIQNEDDASNPNQYQSQIPGLNLAPDHSTGTQNSATPFFKQSHWTGRSRANTVSGAHISGDIPSHLQRYAVMSSVNCSVSNNEPEIVVTVDTGNPNEESKRKKSLKTQTRALNNEPTLVGPSLNKSGQAEVASKGCINDTQYPSPNTNINSHPLPIRPAYTNIPKFQDAFPTLPTIQVSQPPDRLGLKLVSRPETQKINIPSNNQRIHVSSDPFVSPRDGLVTSTDGTYKSSRATDVKSLPNSFEESPGYLQSPTSKPSFSYMNSKPPTVLKIDTKFNQDTRSTQSKFDQVSPFNENSLTSITQGYYSPGLKHPRVQQAQSTQTSSYLENPPAQNPPHTYSDTTSGLGLYGISQANAPDTQHSSHRITNKEASPSVLSSECSPQPPSAGFSMYPSLDSEGTQFESRSAHPQTKHTDSIGYGAHNSPNSYSYPAQHPQDTLGHSPCKNGILMSPLVDNNGSSTNDRSLKTSFDFSRRTYQAYPLQQVTSEEPIIATASNAKLDIQNGRHRVVSQSTLDQSASNEKKPNNYLTNSPPYENSLKQCQIRSYAPTTRIASPLVNVTNASHNSQSYISPYQESMNSHSSNRQLPIVSNNTKQVPRQPSVQLQSVVVPTNEESLDTERFKFLQHATSDVPELSHLFDLDSRPSDNTELDTSHGFYEEEILPVPTSMSIQTNANQRKQWFDVKSYFGHGSRTKHKEKPADLLPVAFSPTTTVTSTPNTVKPKITAIPQFPPEITPPSSHHFEKANPHFRNPYLTSHQISPNLNADQTHLYQQQSPSISSQYGTSFDGNRRNIPVPHSVPIAVPVSSSLPYKDKSAFYSPSSLGTDTDTSTSKLDTSSPSRRQSSGNSIGIMVDYLPQ